LFKFSNNLAAGDICLTEIVNESSTVLAGFAMEILNSPNVVTGTV